MSHGHALTFDALGLLARGLAGVDMAVQPLATGAGSASRLPVDALAPLARAVLAPKRLLLPEGSDPRLRRAMVAHAAAHLRHSAPARPARPVGPLGIALASALYNTPT